MQFQKFDQYREQAVDPQTGEVVEYRTEHQTTYRRAVSEEAFVKIYYDTYLATLGAADNPLSPLLIAIGKRMSYSTTGQVVHLGKDDRADIAAELGGRSDTYIKHNIKKLCDMGILARVGGPRSAKYQVSPFVLAKGDWRDVQALQLSYDARLGQMGVEVPRPKYLEKAHKQGYQPVSDDSTPTLPGAVPAAEITKKTPPDPEKIALEDTVRRQQRQIDALMQLLQPQPAKPQKAAKESAENVQIPGQQSFFDMQQKQQKPSK